MSASKVGHAVAAVATLQLLLYITLFGLGIASRSIFWGVLVALIYVTVAILGVVGGAKDIVGLVVAYFLLTILIAVPKSLFYIIFNKWSRATFDEIFASHDAQKIAPFVLYVFTLAVEGTAIFLSCVYFARKSKKEEPLYTGQPSV
eukprot:EC120814.1.p1 GENE.EC120814.1~~EC120814.1.p1  ORF type:complete len:146 (+),score=3.04 EC120814.1:62-499(+)